MCHGAAGFGSSSFHTPATRAPVSSLLPPWASAIVLPGKRSYFFSLKAKQLPAASPSAARAPAAEPGETGSRLQSLTCRLWRLPHDLAKLHVSTSPVASM